jgi:heme exporter protein C
MKYQLIQKLKRTSLFLSVSFLLVLVSWFLSLYAVGEDKEQGAVYRIIYLHVPLAWSAFLWIFIGGFYGVLSLIKKETFLMEIKTHASMKVATLLMGLVLITGSLWGKATWGVWWDWEPRLTSSLVIFLISTGYLTLRHFTFDKKLRGQLPSVIAILAALNVPIVYLSVNLWRSLHQPQTFLRTADNSSSDIKFMLYLNVASFLLFSYALYRLTKQSLIVEEKVIEGGY